MSGKAAKVIVTDKQHAILEQKVNARTDAHRWIQRAKIILLAFGGMLNMQIPEQVGLNRQQVGCNRGNPNGLNMNTNVTAHCV